MTINLIGYSYFSGTLTHTQSSMESIFTPWEKAATALWAFPRKRNLGPRLGCDLLEGTQVGPTPGSEPRLVSYLQSRAFENAPLGGRGSHGRGVAAVVGVRYRAAVRLAKQQPQRPVSPGPVGCPSPPISPFNATPSATDLAGPWVLGHKNSCACQQLGSSKLWVAQSVPILLTLYSTCSPHQPLPPPPPPDPETWEEHVSEKRREQGAAPRASHSRIRLL